MSVCELYIMHIKCFANQLMKVSCINNIIDIFHFRYISYWKKRFSEQPLTDFCSIIKTNSQECDIGKLTRCCMPVSQRCTFYHGT